jgi:REP element-mobilizing transposase RayT
MLYNAFARQGYKANANVIYSCKYHVVWCPKYRRKVLTGQIAQRFKEIVKGIAAETESEILEIEVMHDQVPFSARLTRRQSSCGGAKGVPLAFCAKNSRH